MSDLFGNHIVGFPTRRLILYYWWFQSDFSVVVLIIFCFDVEFLCCLHLLYVFIYLVKFMSQSGHLFW